MDTARHSGEDARVKRILVAALAIAALLATATPAHATATRHELLVYGDSLTWESTAQITAQFATRPGWTVVVHSFPGTAPCDWLGWLASDLATYQPTIVAVETAGNATRPCMADANGNAQAQDSPGFLADYQADLAQFMQTVTATGAKFLYVNAPPMASPYTLVWNQSIIDVNTIAASLAGQYHGVSITNGPRVAVSTPAGKFVAYKPCLPTETAAQGCVAKKIAMRTLAGLQAGIHFCPSGLSGYPFYACSTYSSGEFRWARALRIAAMRPPAPVLP